MAVARNLKLKLELRSGVSDQVGDRDRLSDSATRPIAVAQLLLLGSTPSYYPIRPGM